MICGIHIPRRTRDAPDDGLTREERARRWRIENAAVIKEYNARFDREGTIGIKVWAQIHAKR